jgi:hypothetical protein
MSFLRKWCARIHLTSNPFRLKKIQIGQFSNEVDDPIFHVPTVRSSTQSRIENVSVDWATKCAFGLELIKHAEGNVVCEAPLPFWANLGCVQASAAHPEAFELSSGLRNAVVRSETIVFHYECQCQRFPDPAFK